MAEENASPRPYRREISTTPVLALDRRQASCNSHAANLAHTTPFAYRECCCIQRDKDEDADDEEEEEEKKEDKKKDEEEEVIEK